MTNLRLFIAVEVEDKAVVGHLTTLQDQLRFRGVKPTRPDQLHFTLHFLGDTSPDLLPPLKEIMDRLTVSSFELSLSRVGAFPNTRKPRVVWVGVDKGVAEVQELHSCLKEGLEELGLQTDSRPYHPHLTLARVKFVEGQGQQRLAEFFRDHTSYNAGTSMVRQVVLKKSTLTPKGPVYEDMHVTGLTHGT